MYANHANANHPGQCSPCEGPYSDQRQQVKPQCAAASGVSGFGLVGVLGAPREAHVPEEISMLQGAVGSLTETVDNLLQRLSPVLAPVPTEPCGKEELDTYRVPVADDIRVQRRFLQTQVARLQDALRALEL